MDMDKRSSDLEAALRIVLQQTLNIVLQAQEKLPEANVVPSTPPTSPSTDIGEQMASFWNIPSPNPPATSATSSTSPEEEIPCICFNCWGNVAAAANSKTWKSPNQADFRSAAAPLTEGKRKKPRLISQISSTVSSVSSVKSGTNRHLLERNEVLQRKVQLQNEIIKKLIELANLE